MRTVMLLGSFLFLGLLVFVPALGTASEADLVATSGIPTKLLGRLDSNTARGVLALDAGSSDITIAGEPATVETIRVTSSYVRLPLADLTGERRVDASVSTLGAGSLRIESLGDEFLVAARGTQARLQSSQAYGPSPAADFWSQANGQLVGLIAAETLSAPLPPEKLAQVNTGQAPFIAIDEGSYAIAGQGKATMERLDEALVYGARLIGPDGRVVGESRRSVLEKPGNVYLAAPTGGSWAGPGTHTEETVEYFRITSPRASLQSMGPATLYADDLRVHVTGYIGFPWAEGTLRTTNETVDLSGEQVILGGDLRLRPIGFDAQGAPQITLLGNGNVQYVQIGVEERKLANVEAAAVAGGAAAGLGILGLLVYFWPSVKYGASLVLFPLYARVPKENTLDHKGRELLYDLIKTEPGVSTNKLAKEVPFGWSTLTYHLRVLERNEAIVSVRDGRYKRFFDRQSGRFANGRKYILAVLKNDATFDIARFIRQKPGSSQKEVATHFQLSPSSVHWHVERLSEVGLVNKAREAHNVKYNPGEAWDHVTIEDLKALEDAGPEPAEQALVAPSAPVSSQSAAPQ
jgi:DNA-binding transcriptional ArsR family regulator